MSSIASLILTNAERRAHEREVTTEDAFTIAAHSTEGIACQLKDISEGGACVEVAAECLLPKQFRLYIPERQLLAECALVWRSGNRAGLKFESIATMAVSPC